MGAGTEKETTKCACYEAHEERFRNIAIVIGEIKDANKDHLKDYEEVKAQSIKTSSSYKSLHLRVDKVENQTAAIFELSGSVKELAGNVASMMGNLQKQEEIVNERFEKQAVAIDTKLEKQAVAIDKKFENQTEVIQNLATEQNKASKTPGALALKAWWFVIGGIVIQGIRMASDLIAAGMK